MVRCHISHFAPCRDAQSHQLHAARASQSALTRPIDDWTLGTALHSVAFLTAAVRRGRRTVSMVSRAPVRLPLSNDHHRDDGDDRKHADDRQCNGQPERRPGAFRGGHRGRRRSAAHEWGKGCAATIAQAKHPRREGTATQGREALESQAAERARHFRLYSSLIRRSMLPSILLTPRPAHSAECGCESRGGAA